MDTIRILEHDENRAKGYMLACLAREAEAATCSGLYEADRSEYESLKGPQEDRGWLPLEELDSYEIEYQDSYKALKEWYFDTIDAFRTFIERLCHYAHSGYPLYRSDLYTVISALHLHDEKAVDAGWKLWRDEKINGRFVPVRRDGYHWLETELEDADVLTQEYKQEVLQEEEYQRVSYLKRIGYIRKDGAGWPTLNATLWTRSGVPVES